MVLTAFAYQAIEAERRARLADRSRVLRAEAEGLVHDADELLRGRTRALAGELSLVRDATEGVEPARRIVAREPMFRGFVVLDAAGRRVHPAAPPRAIAGAAPRVGLPGGIVGAMMHVDEAERLLAIEESGRHVEDRGPAIEALNELVRRGSPATRTAALYDLGRLHEANATRTDMFNAQLVYGELRRLPLGTVDARGRPAAALGRFRHALIYHTLQNGFAFREGLQQLVAELERGAESLPADAVVELAERAGDLLQDPKALAEARAIGARRLQVEQAAVRVEQLFGPQLQAALASASRSAMAQPTFLKARAVNRHDLVTCAPVWGRGERPTGLVVVDVDVEALEREVRTRVRSRGWGGELVAVSTLPASAPDEPSDTTSLPLRPPLEHAAVVVHAAPEPPNPMADALDLPRDSVYFWAIAIAVGGLVGGVLATTRTVLREAKAAQLKSDFVSNVTHELKTPLTSIRMFLDTLLLGRVTDEAEAKECLQIMARESERLTRLIEQLLVFSRIESKKWRLKLGFESPRALVDEALRILADQLGKPKDELEIEVVAVQDLPQIAVDRFAVVEAILNILHNAWKYTPGPDRQLRVVMSSRRRHVEIAVEDNGIGVPRRDRRRIFVKFERGSNAEERRIEGSGIGLTLALSIVAAHGGTITYAPNKPVGSKFSIWLRK